MIMDQKNQIDVSKIPEIFHNMTYGEQIYDTNKAIEWLKQKKNLFAFIEKSHEGPTGIPSQLNNCLTAENLCTIIVPEIDTIKQILSKTCNDVKWIDTMAVSRSKMLYSLGQEIEKNSELFAGIDLVIRGLIPSHTKNYTIPLLAQYFYYYSIFAMVYSQENSNWKPPGVSIGVYSSESTLSNLGLHLAPALAAGYNVILHVGTKIAPVAFLFLDLAKKVGIDESVIRIIPTDDGELLPYFNSDNVCILTLFTNVYGDKYRGVNYTNKKILTLCPSTIPIMIFDNADLDSACESILSTVWNPSSSLTWSPNMIFVQENVMSHFLDKLKGKMKSIKVGRADEKKIDVSYPLTMPVSRFNDLLKHAEQNGYEVFRSNDDQLSWSPTLLIGCGTPLNFTEEEIEGNITIVVSFRSTTEAIALANNLKQGMGISIWSENVGVINELKQNVDTTNIWINKSPKFAADVTFSPIKLSGNGYFGGKQGFYEYVEIDKTNSVAPSCSSSLKSKSLLNTINKVIDGAKKSQSTWKNVEVLKKINNFQKVIEYLEETKLREPKQIKSIDIWIGTILECISGLHNSGSSILFELTQYQTSVRFPKGVIVTYVEQKLETSNIKLIIAAIFEGNTVVLVNNCDDNSLYTAISKQFPSGVLNYSAEVNTIGEIFERQDISVFIENEEVNPVFTRPPIQNNSKATAAYSWVNIFKKITYVKNIWNW